MNSLELFGIGYSWGAFKSLITVGKYKRSHQSTYPDKTIVRLNIGLQDTADLINELEKGLSNFCKNALKLKK